MSATVVLDPGVRFDAVAARFARWDGGPTDRHAWLAGEPIGARWTRDGAAVSYSGDPAIGLRVLSGAGAPFGLPVLTAAGARALARSDDLERALLGVTAAGLYGDLEAMPALAALSRDPRPGVAQAAELALRRIGVACLTLAGDRLGERRREAPGDDPAFGLMGPPAMRRQLIRWIGAEPPRERERTLALVRAALHDADWEVRWSAVIAAFQLDLGELALDVKRCAPAERAHAADRRILEALRSVVGWHLVGGEADVDGATHLRDCLTGRATRHDRAFLLVTALRHPLPVTPAPPAPAGFRAVPAALHWIGDPDLSTHRLRSVMPAAFAIAETPHGNVLVANLDSRLSALSDELGLPLRLPSAQESEMAARGLDGRRYPWGNGRERAGCRQPSPWGVREPLATPEWVWTDAGAMTLGDARGGCAGRPRPAERAALRPVVDQAVA